MKNFLIFLSIIVVTLLAAADLVQRLSELDEISKETQIKIEEKQQNQNDSNSFEQKSDTNYIKTHK